MNRKILLYGFLFLFISCANKQEVADVLYDTMKNRFEENFDTINIGHDRDTIVIKIYFNYVENHDTWAYLISDDIVYQVNKNGMTNHLVKCIVIFNNPLYKTNNDNFISTYSRESINMIMGNYKVEKYCKMKSYSLKNSSPLAFLIFDTVLLEMEFEGTSNYKDFLELLDDYILFKSGMGKNNSSEVLNELYLNIIEKYDYSDPRIREMLLILEKLKYYSIQN